MRATSSDDQALDIEAEMDVLTEYNTQEPIQHGFDPYTQNGGSVLGTSNRSYLYSYLSFPCLLSCLCPRILGNFEMGVDE